MNQKYKIIVLSRCDHFPFEKEHTDLTSAQGVVEHLKEAMSDKNGKFIDEYSFDDDDVILIADPDGKIVHAWQRHADLMPEDFSKLDLSRVSDKFNGWQMMNPDGWNMHGDDDDPYDLPSFAILVDNAVPVAREWVRKNEDYFMAPVYAGDIEAPMYVHSLPDLTPRP